MVVPTARHADRAGVVTSPIELPNAMPVLEAFFWWATLGTSCCIVTAVTEDDAKTLVAHRFRQAQLGAWRGRVSKATPEQWRRFTATMEQGLEHERRMKEWAK